MSWDLYAHTQEGFKGEIERLLGVIKDRAAERDAALARVAKLEAALLWYANASHYRDDYTEQTGYARRTSAEMDGGARARAALEVQP